MSDLEETEIYQIKKGGEVLFTGTANECFIKLLRIQPFSTHYALKYGGYAIERKSEEETMEQFTWKQAIELASKQPSGGWCNVTNQEYKQSCKNEHAGLIALHISSQKYRVQNTRTAEARDDLNEAEVPQALTDLCIADSDWSV